MNLAIFMAAVLSLGVSLAYGFAMDKDFSTGFSIGSWLITAVGFIAALVSISEYAGQESVLEGMIPNGPWAEGDEDTFVV